LFIRTRRAANDLVLEVEHDGHLSEADQQNIQALLASGDPAQSGGHVGLKNVHQRLRLLYGERGLLSVENTPAGTILVRVCLPLPQIAQA
jgi:LytS/YehU family sensor histidine kinase